MDTLKLLAFFTAVTAMILITSAVLAQLTQALLVIPASQAILISLITLCWYCYRLATRFVNCLYKIIRLVVEAAFRKHAWKRSRKLNGNADCGVIVPVGSQLRHKSNSNAAYSFPRVFRFLALPLEIRENIYQQTIEHYAQLECKPSRIVRPRNQFRHTMPLMRTCRQIRSEATATAFSSTLLDVWTRNPFYRRLAPHLWLLLREIHLVACPVRPIRPGRPVRTRLHSTFPDLRHMLNLQDIYVTMDDADEFLAHVEFLSAGHADLKRTLTRLSLFQILVKCLEARNLEIRQGMDHLLMDAEQFWPAGSKIEFWRSYIGRNHLVTKVLFATSGHAPAKRCALEEQPYSVY